VRGRLKKISRWCVLLHAKYTAHLSIQEAITYDGLENFAFSQFDPNNINHAIGKESLFTYDFNYAPLNRKGRMTAKQRTQKKALEEKFGPYPRDAIRVTTKRIFERLIGRCSSSVTVFSDSHYMYEGAGETLPKGRLEHIKISSKAYRNYQNKLFAVNHLDMLARHSCISFKRETIAFSKHSIAMQEAFMRLVAFKNYMRGTFLKPHKNNPYIDKISPAMSVGLTKHILSFREFFKERVTRTQVQLNKDMEWLFCSIDKTTRRRIRPYAGI
jgi:hypothetical protein